MTQDSLQTYRDLVAGAAGILQIPMAPDEVVSPMTFHFEDMDVMLTHDPRGEDHGVIYSVSFGQAPKERELDLYREFLDANVFWGGTRGATIGVDSATGEAILCLRVGLADLRPADVAEMAAAMIEMGALWRHVIEGEDGGQPLATGEQIIRA